MNTKKILTTQNMIQIAMFTAVLSILSQISFQLPFGIPITLQTFAIFLIGTVLGPKLGTISVLLYLLLGSVGVPVFANFNSGLSALVGPTGGFLVGFLPMVYLIGLGKKRPYYVSLIFSITGLLVCYILGLYMYFRITGNWILLTLPPLFVKDVITAFLAVFLGKEISQRVSYLSLSSK